MPALMEAQSFTHGTVLSPGQAQKLSPPAPDWLCRLLVEAPGDFESLGEEI